MGARWNHKPDGEGGYLKEFATPWKTRDEAYSCQDPWAYGEKSPCESRFADRTYAVDPHWSSLFLKDFTLWKGPMIKEFIKNSSLWVD
ncbi:suppression of tumorigenicity 5 protein isoform x4 [Willisornis vidua]|uniref:Suppression of tumorigenicity 5 protein isoform x4 n=1 Tax=Willisornis vidua TaxID=1566151 RepID=A0ABQ9DWU1_9PASS|nr:suppression of tumorigenicity 5 protein isoform x4 [Willisornis vidua]